MIKTAIGSRSDVTVVLLGHDQSGSRARALHYYAQAGVPCMALEPLSEMSAAGVWLDHLSMLLKQVQTPFVSLALDTDFVLPTALDQAAACLHAQPQSVAAQGYVLAYAAASSEVAYHKVGSAFAPLQAPDAVARLTQYAQAGQQAWRAVQRVAILQAAVAAAPSELDFAGMRVALSLALLAQGEVVQLEQTDVLAEWQAGDAACSAREERLTQTVRALREWDEARDGLCAGDDGFVLLNQFVRNSYDLIAAPLIFTSKWTSVIDDPQRDFEPRQDVQLPYYNGALFAQLTELEFLNHAWPTGQQHQQALEGVWVRQRDLLVQHPNDTAESLQYRYWQAFAMGMFNADVCRELLASLSAEADAQRRHELVAWLARLERVPAVDNLQQLQATPSGHVLAAIAAATPDASSHKRVLAHLNKHAPAQLAYVVLDLENDDLALQATFDSLLASGLRNFKLLVLKAGKPPTITTPRDTLHFIQVSDSNWVKHLNQAVAQLPSEWLLLLEAGDVLLPGGLLRLQVELSEAPACQAIAANEVQRDDEGRLHSVTRPGANLDLLRSQPGLMARHWLLRRQTLLDLGGYSEAHPNAAELDVLLRLVESQGVASLAHMDEFLVIGRQASPASKRDAVAVVNRHLTQLGYRSQVNDQGASGLVIDFRHSSTPLVSILLAFEGNLAQLQACLTSVLQRTRYPRYEIIVAGADQAFASEAAARALGGRVRLVSAAPGASRSDLLNLAASQARGDYLLLLSTRCHVVTPAWIEGLLNEAQRPEVGVVGARLLEAADGSLVHAGYELLAGPQVYSPWQGLSMLQAASNSWASSVRSCAAVSADCLMVRKDVFDQCGGLQGLAGADINLCLAAKEAGLMVVWTPRSQLLLSPADSVVADPAAALAERWPGAFHGEAQFGHACLPHSQQAWLAQL